MKFFRPSFRLLEDSRPTEISLTLPSWEIRGPRRPAETTTRISWQGSQSALASVQHHHTEPLKRR